METNKYVVYKGGHLDTMFLDKPVNFIRSNRYHYTDSIENAGYSSYWQNKTVSNGYAYNVTFSSTLLDHQLSYYDKGFGFPLRCLVPLGSLQLPTYNGTKSYQNLLVEVYGGTKGSLAGSHIDVTTYNNPFKNINNGIYYYSGSIGARSTQGSYWIGRAIFDTSANVLVTFSSYSNAQSNYLKGYGLSLRCLVR